MEIITNLLGRKARSKALRPPQSSEFGEIVAVYIATTGNMGERNPRLRIAIRYSGGEIEETNLEYALVEEV